MELSVEPCERQSMRNLRVWFLQRYRLGGGCRRRNSWFNCMRSNCPEDWIQKWKNTFYSGKPWLALLIVFKKQVRGAAKRRICLITICCFDLFSSAGFSTSNMTDRARKTKFEQNIGQSKSKIIDTSSCFLQRYWPTWIYIHLTIMIMRRRRR